MSNFKDRRRATTAAFILSAFLIHSLPAGAQDIIQSDDNSSVFVFRNSSRAAQTKLASRNFLARGVAQKAASRGSVREAIARAARSRPKSPAAGTVASNQNKPPRAGGSAPQASPSKALTKAQLAEQLAVIGEANLDRKNYDEAIRAFRDALAANSNNARAKIGLSEALIYKGDQTQEKSGAENSLAVYTEAKTLNPQNAAAYAALGGAYEETEKTDLALANYAEAVRLNSELKELYAPLGALYYQKGEIAKADEFLSKAAPDAQTLYLLGMIRSKQNRNDEAIATLKNSNQLKPTAEAHYYLGEVYDRMNRPEEAISEYKRAIGIDPNFAAAWFDLGAAYYNRARDEDATKARGHYEDSIKAYEKAVVLKNDNPEAFENLGDAHRQLKNYKEAEMRYNHAIGFLDRKMPVPSGARPGGISRREADPKGAADLYSKLGFVQGNLMKWEAAINNLENAIKTSPDAYDYTNLGWAYYNAARVDISLKRQPEAQAKLLRGKAALERAVAMNVNNAGTYMNLGLTQNELGEVQAAVNSFNKCLALRANWVPALNERGYAYSALKQYDQAAADFRRVIELDKKYHPAFYNLAEAEFRRGNLKEAKKLRDAMLKIDPNSKLLQQRAKQLDVIFMGAVLTAPAQQPENKDKNKAPKPPY